MTSSASWHMAASTLAAMRCSGAVGAVGTVVPIARPGLQRSPGVRSKGSGRVHRAKPVLAPARADEGKRTSPAMLAPQDAETDAAAVRVACMHDQAQAPQVGPQLATLAATPCRHGSAPTCVRQVLGDPCQPVEGPDGGNGR